MCWSVENIFEQERKRKEEKRGGMGWRVREARQNLAKKTETKNEREQAGGPRDTCWEQAYGRKRLGISTSLREENYDICMAAKGHIFSKFQSDLPHTAPSHSEGSLPAPVAAPWIKCTQ